MSDDKQERPGVDCGWSVGHATLSDGKTAVMISILNGPMALDAEDAEHMAAALLIAAKNCREYKS